VSSNQTLLTHFKVAISNTNEKVKRYGRHPASATCLGSFLTTQPSLPNHPTFLHIPKNNLKGSFKRCKFIEPLINLDETTYTEMITNLWHLLSLNTKSLPQTTRPNGLNTRRNQVIMSPSTLLQLT
jgi:hypothetical protein